MSTELNLSRNQSQNQPDLSHGTTIGEWLTIERLIYGAILLVGGFMRFFALEAQPLNEGEAATSIAAWTAAMGFESRQGIGLLIDSVPPTSPLLYSLQGILFWLAGGSDVLARLWPAAAGTGLVLLPWFVRNHIGRYTAISLSILFAIDPWLGAYSRLANGTSLSALLGMIVLLGLSLLHDDARLHNPNGDSAPSRWRTIIWIALGLLVVSGPQAWSFGIVLILFLAFYGIPNVLLADLQPRADGTLQNAEEQVTANQVDADDAAADDPVDIDVEGGSIETDMAENDLSADAAPLLQAEVSSRVTSELDDGLDEPLEPMSSGSLGIVLTIGALLLGATGWLAFPEGLSYIGSSLSLWVEQIGGSSSAQSPLYSLEWLRLRLAVDQPLLILFGLVSLVVLWFAPKSDGFDADFNNDVATGQARAAILSPQFLSMWMVLGVVLALLPGRGPYSLVMLGLPLILISAKMLGLLTENLVNAYQTALANQAIRVKTMGSRAADYQPFPWTEIRLVLLTMTALSVLFGFVVSSLLNNSQISTTLLLTGALILGIALLLVVILALMIGWVSARRVIGLYVGLLLCVAGISNSWHLNHRNEPLRPDAFFERITHVDMRTLVEDIRTLSAQRIGDPEEVAIRAELGPYPEPVLAWYLRNMRNLTWTPSPAVDNAANAQFVLLTFGESVTSRAASESYLGSDYTLRQRWLPDQLPTYDPASAGDELTAIQRLEQRWSAELRPLANWMVYRKIPDVPQSEKVVLWTRGF